MASARDAATSEPTSPVQYPPPRQVSTMPLEGSSQRPSNTTSDLMMDGPTYHGFSGGLRRRATTKAERPYMRRPYRPDWHPGAEPGLDTQKDDVEPHLADLHANCEITVVDFSPEQIAQYEVTNQTLPKFLDTPRADWVSCRWININRLSWDVIKLLGNKHSLHSLAIEDMVNTKSRTKADWYSDQAFFVLTLQKLVAQMDQHSNCPRCASDDENARSTFWWRKFRQRADPSSSEQELDPENKLTDAEHIERYHSPQNTIRTIQRYGASQNSEHTAFMEYHSALADQNLAVSVEQVSVFILADNTVISFFEHSADDIELPILKRLNNVDTVLRRSADASMLVQALIDGIIDLAIEVVHAYGYAKSELELTVMTDSSADDARSLHVFRSEVTMLHNVIQPILSLVRALRDHTSGPMPFQGAGSKSRPTEHLYSPFPSDSHTRRPRAQVPPPVTSNVVISTIAHTYFGDIEDHCITIMQQLEQLINSAKDISDYMFNTRANKTNDFMKILAIVTVFFAPLTFISGYFGQNFVRFTGVQTHSDAFFWAISVPVMAVFMPLVGWSTLSEYTKRFRQRRNIKKMRKERVGRRVL
ncbi:hypothetical protein LTR66_006534 [Elasticomyces elasticus]|nr:hypothetical protein LTR50_003444 [Elasticomyces elasticus]KAK4991500.1 hypothetical protein LTR66_006534 [Elasticomyces elasticus]